jgi:5-methylcytosine-specific restriction endonuclease McrBC GTP-binding regulatory subunit McrB
MGHDATQPHKRQAIFFGPPGTGKTFVAKKLGQFLASPSGDVQVVQFHPSFSYEDFLEGLRPDEQSDEFRYTIRPGIFADFCERARKKPDSTCAFVIDEVNRADLGSVFGELMMLLEYRGEKLTLPYSQRPFSIPKNVVVLPQ